jgi:hypothetical protein
MTRSRRLGTPRPARRLSGRRPDRIMGRVAQVIKGEQGSQASNCGWTAGNLRHLLLFAYTSGQRTPPRHRRKNAWRSAMGI